MSVSSSSDVFANRLSNNEHAQARGTTVFFVEICSFRFTVTMHERNIFDTREKYEQEGHNTAFTKNQKKKFPLFYSIDQRKPA